MMTRQAQADRLCRVPTTPAVAPEQGEWPGEGESYSTINERALQAEGSAEHGSLCLIVAFAHLHAYDSG